QAPEAREGLRQRTAEAPRAPRTPVATPSKPLVRPSSSPFRVTEELGRGLLGTTFKGIDTRNGRPVTVKFLRKDLLGDRAVVQQFLTEARLAQSLEHPSLVRLLGLTEIKGEKAAIMEYVDGFDLGKFLSRNKRLSVKQAVDVLTTLCMALGHAHERKLLHRDLKLTNVLIARGGKLRLAGFGLGALRTPGLGKADGYPSPEFLSGGSLDERSDIFSMGGLVLHTLSGVDPGSQELAFNGALPSLRQLVPNIPEGLAQILSCCLAEEPGARFHTMSEVLAAAGPLRG
ncbi:MAG: serine/threonine-protein kinase, partial [Acidobacteriota bacterium]